MHNIFCVRKFGGLGWPERKQAVSGRQEGAWQRGDFVNDRELKNFRKNCSRPSKTWPSPRCVGGGVRGVCKETSVFNGSELKSSRSWSIGTSAT